MNSSCYHCGESIEKEKIVFNEKLFCCNGCKSVFEILNINNLGNFYKLNKGAGIKPANSADEYNYLDATEVFEKIVDFSEGSSSLVTFKIPVIHCSSCIWLLESLHTLNENIKYSQVNFTRKTLQIAFNNENLQLSKLAGFLANLGYKPLISLETADQKKEVLDKTLLVKFAIAGFTFGNGMFLSIPEYFGAGDLWIEENKNLLRGILFIFATVVAFYCASDYYKAAWHGLKNKIINIEVPIVIGIFMLYGRSIYEVVTDYGSGYFDTLCGLLFWMLLGKIFQKRTYNALSYDRDYKSFYPIAVTKLNANEQQENILLSNIQVGDRILVRNQEIIPVDAIVISGEGNIDNSFITGESNTVAKKSGDKIFAGGKQLGSSLVLEVIKNVNQSYLTQLWNKDAFKKNDTGLDTFTNKISKHFTIVILSITLIAGLYWYFIDVEKMFQVAAAILIVACPCALALSAPFTFGHIMRILGKHKFYVKDTLTIDRIARINTLVFDKTGTITHRKKSNIAYVGKEINQSDLSNLKTLFNNSNHPLSRLLYDSIDVEDQHCQILEFTEIAGKGYTGQINSIIYKIGSASFNGKTARSLETAVYISKNDEFLGKFTFKNEYRPGFSKLFQKLQGYKYFILSGDNSSEENNLLSMIPSCSGLAFDQSPEDKLNYIKNLQTENLNVAMFGDGLNDAGALKQSNVGIAISDDTNSFTPSSDVIMNGEKLPELDKYLNLCKGSIVIVKIMFGVSFLYNIFGLSYAVTGNMSPLFAAIIMPVSSITVVAFTTFSTWILENRLFKD